MPFPVSAGRVTGEFPDYETGEVSMSAGRWAALPPEEIIAQLRGAGLRQRAGRGLLLADRWQALLEAEGEKHVVCDAIESDSRTDAVGYLLAHKAQAVVEGLMIAVRATGATKAVVCLAEHHDDERARLEEAAAALGGGTTVALCEVPAGLVAAEETAIIRAIENREPLPYLRPDGDVTGVNGAPTLVEAAETLAAVAAVFSEEPEVPPETKIVAVFGDVPGGRTLAVPLGTTLGSVVAQVAGEGEAAGAVKAVQFGGPAGPFLSGEALDTPITVADLEAVGACLGSGALEVFGAGRCGVEMAREITARLHEESCGKCVFCREGSRQMLDILGDIVEFRATDEHLELLRELAEAMPRASICSVGQRASLPVLSALELFADDFAAHLSERRCPETTT